MNILCKFRPVSEMRYRDVLVKITTANAVSSVRSVFFECCRLNEAVKRNLERFPEDFMFQLTKEEVVDSENNNVSRSHFATLKTIRGENIKYLPYAFTENGIAMLSGVLKSSIAIQVNIQIMRAFVAMRHTLLDNTLLFNRIEHLEHHQLLMIERQDKTDSQIETIFKALSKLNSISATEILAKLI